MVADNRVRSTDEVKPFNQRRARAARSTERRRARQTPEQSRQLCIDNVIRVIDGWADSGERGDLGTSIKSMLGAIDWEAVPRGIIKSAFQLILSHVPSSVVAAVNTDADGEAAILAEAVAYVGGNDAVAAPATPPPRRAPRARVRAHLMDAIVEMNTALDIIDTGRGEHDPDNQRDDIRRASASLLRALAPHEQVEAEFRASLALLLEGESPEGDALREHVLELAWQFHTRAPGCGLPSPFLEPEPSGPTRRAQEVR
jgi:hypothetical protein